MAQVKSTKAKRYFIVNLWMIRHHHFVEPAIGEYENLGNRSCGRDWYTVWQRNAKAVLRACCKTNPYPDPTTAGGCGQDLRYWRWNFAS